MAIEKKVRYPNLQPKIEARREFVYFQWLRGKTQPEIVEILKGSGWTRGASIETVVGDLRYVIEHLPDRPMDMEKIRQTALMELELDRQQVLKVAAIADPKVAWHYWTIAADINKTVLERYTQVSGSRGEIGVTVTSQEREKALIDYVIEKLGPESIADFESYWKIRMQALKLKGAKSEQPGQQ